MPWYKIDIRHGPGHQGRDVFYKWSDHNLKEAERHELFDDSCAAHWDWPRGTVRKVGELPEDESNQ